MGTVATRNLKKSFGALDVIKDININIEHGEFAVLVGPSGCGKSTLLRIIAGLDDASAGEIAIGGRNVTNLPPKERDIAMVFQNYALYPHMSVAENMGFSLFLAGKPKAEIEEEVNRAADILGLTPLLSRKPLQLSGGQRQRVAMGRAIVRKPSVFLFDEPLSNLDAKLRVKMRGEIKAMHQKLGPTVIYVTHDQIEAMTMADKIIVVDGGRISQIGAPLDLYDNPTNVFVATFIGSPAMNILPAIVEGDRGLRLRDGQVVVFPHAANPGDKVQIGIRPEHLGISSPENGIAAEVRMVEPTGSETHITAEVAGSEIVAVVRDRVKVAVGDRIGMQAHQPSRYYLFREDNGLVINHVMA